MILLSIFLVVSVVFLVAVFYHVGHAAGYSKAWTDARNSRVKAHEALLDGYNKKALDAIMKHYYLVPKNG